jgi:hypothetical protein
MPVRPRKSSAQVTLVLLGVAALAGCGSPSDPPAAQRRDIYASREDCIADWGDPKDCEERAPQASGVRSRGYWYGPAYGSGWGGGYGGTGPHAGHSIGSESVTRGGFGASGQAHASGGS